MNDDMEKLDLIYNAVKETKKDLQDHIKEEAGEFKAIRRDIAKLSIETALRKQQAGYIGVFVAMVTSAVVSGIAIFVSGVWRSS